MSGLVALIVEFSLFNIISVLSLDFVEISWLAILSIEIAFSVLLNRITDLEKKFDRDKEVVVVGAKPPPKCIWDNAIIHHTTTMAKCPFFGRMAR